MALAAIRAPPRAATEIAVESDLFDSKRFLFNRYLQHSFQPEDSEYRLKGHVDNASNAHMERALPKSWYMKKWDYLTNSETYVTSIWGQRITKVYLVLWGLKYLIQFLCPHLAFFQHGNTGDQIFNYTGYAVNGLFILIYVIPGLISMKDGAKEFKDKQYMKAFNDFVLYGVLQLLICPSLFIQAYLPQHCSDLVLKSIIVLNGLIMTPYFFKSIASLKTGSKFRNELFQKDTSLDDYIKKAEDGYVFTMNDVRKKELLENLKELFVKELLNEKKQEIFCKNLEKWEEQIGADMVERLMCKLEMNIELEEEDLLKVLVNMKLRKQSEKKKLLLGIGSLFVFIMPFWTPKLFHSKFGLTKKQSELVMNFSASFINIPFMHLSQKIMQESNQRRLVRFTGHTPQLLTDPEYIRSVIPTLNPEFDMRSLSDRDILKKGKKLYQKIFEQSLKIFAK